MEQDRNRVRVDVKMELGLFMASWEMVSPGKGSRRMYRLELVSIWEKMFDADGIDALRVLEDDQMERV